MIWDPIQRRYEDEKGNPIPAKTIRKHVDDFIKSEQNQVAKEAGKVLVGTLTVAAFFQFMREKVAAWHTIAGVIAYGGESQMDAERWARINQKVTKELEFLAGFEQEAKTSFKAVEAIAEKAAGAYPDAQAEIKQAVSKALFRAAPSEAEAIANQVVGEIVGESAGVTIGKEAADLIGGQIESRAAMYTDAAWGTFENNVMAREFDEGVNLGRRICANDEASCDECVAAATEEFIPLDQIEEIGTLQCLGNCRCELEFLIEGQQFQTSDIFQGVVSGQPQYGGDVTLQ